jgi:CspA family cold shock protein
MIGFKVTHETLLEVVVPMAAAKSQAWREGFRKCIAGFNATAGRELSIAYALPHELVPNGAQATRIAHCQEYLFQGQRDELEGFLAGWLHCHREEFQQVIWGQVEGPQAVPDLRQAMYRVSQRRPARQGVDMQSGTIKRLVAERGFGFIAGEDGKEYFFHRSEVEGAFLQLEEGDQVQFVGDLASPKGPRAVQVAPIIGSARPA